MMTELPSKLEERLEILKKKHEEYERLWEEMPSELKERKLEILKSWGEEQSYEEKRLECKALEDNVEKIGCLSDLLHEVTKEQDSINLSIPFLNDSVQLLKLVVDGANGIILEASRYKGHVMPAMEGTYLQEKMKFLIDSYNNMVHDYNLTKDEKFIEKIAYSFISERDLPNPKRKEWSKHFYRGFESED
jgi:hypothetical protein